MGNSETSNTGKSFLSLGLEGQVSPGWTGAPEELLLMFFPWQSQKQPRLLPHTWAGRCVSALVENGGLQSTCCSQEASLRQDLLCAMSCGGPETQLNPLRSCSGAHIQGSKLWATVHDTSGPPGAWMGRGWSLRGGRPEQVSPGAGDL